MNDPGQRPRVLVIPTWYPTTANPITGSFFREQALLLQERFDLRVLYGIGRPVYYRQAWREYRWIARPGLARLLPLDPSFILTPPPAVGFEFAHRSKTEEDRLNSMIAAYRQRLTGLIAEGWTPDLIHAHVTERGGIIAAALAREFGIPMILTEHHIFVLAQYGELQRKWMIDALNSATEVIAVSNHQLRCIALHSINRPMRVMGNLIDEELFPLSIPRRDPARFRILSVTWPHPIKDAGTFFRAIARMVALGHGDIEVTVVGNWAWGNLAEANTDEFERLAAEHGVTGVCRFIAHVPRAEMPDQYAACDVFVSSSIAETFGVAVREAMTVGRPAVCTASGGVEDDLSPVNGVRVAIGDHEALCAALIDMKTGRLQFDPVEVRDSIVSRHGRAAFLANMTGIYHNVLVGDRSRPEPELAGL